MHLAKILRDLHAHWKPHPGQIQIIRKIFGENASFVMSEWGRKAGKTETIQYFLVRGALTRGGGWFYLSPEQKQSKEIIWASGRLQRFIPPQYIASINNTEMRITLTNGAYLKAEGSDNIDSLRGIEPHGVAYDELKDFRPEFHEAFGPNLVVYKAPLLVCGTPPERELAHYDSMIERAKERGCYYNLPSWVNTHLDRDWLRQERDTLIRRGDTHVWEREFCARRIDGGKNAIFPMFDKAKHVRPHAEIMAEIHKDRKKLIWQCVADPGNASVFAVLFRAINPFNKKVYHLDEIYETNQAETSTSRIAPRAAAIRAELFPDSEACGVEWDLVYDEAATWFATEALNTYGESWVPTAKAERDIDSGLSLIKDQLLAGLTVNSDRCINLGKELVNFIRDPKTGKPRRDCHDHLLDAFRYANSAAGLDLSPEREPDPADPDDAKRYSTPERDQEEAGSSDDEAFGVLDDF